MRIKYTSFSLFKRIGFKDKHTLYLMKYNKKKNKRNIKKYVKYY